MAALSRGRLKLSGLVFHPATPLAFCTSRRGINNRSPFVDVQPLRHPLTSTLTRPGNAADAPGRAIGLFLQRQQQRSYSTSSVSLEEVRTASSLPSQPLPQSIDLLSVAPQLQRICLAPSSSSSSSSSDSAEEAGTVPRWQQCLDVFFASSPGSSLQHRVFTEETLVDLLESLSPQHADTPPDTRPDGEAGAPSSSPPLAEHSKETVGCLLEWLLYACTTSEAPAPLTAALYTAYRILSPTLHAVTVRRGQPSQQRAPPTEEGNEEPCEKPTLLPMPPWRERGLHACYARYLLAALHRAGADASANTTVANREVLFLFESLFKVLLLDSAEDAVRPSSGEASKHLGRRQTLATSATLQLMLLDGLRQLLVFRRLTGTPRGEDDAMEAQLFPVLTWLMHTGKTSASSAISVGEDDSTTDSTELPEVGLPHVDELARTCLRKLEPTGSAQAGLLLYWCVFLEQCNDSYTASWHRSVHAAVSAMDAIVAVHGGFLLNLTSPAATLPLSRPAVNDALSVAHHVEHARDAVMTTRSVASPTESSNLFTDALYQSVARVSQLSASQQLQVFSRVFAAFLDCLRGSDDEYQAISPLLSRALLLPCVRLSCSIELPDSSQEDAELSVRPVLWYLSALFHETLEARQRGEQDWKRATTRCVGLLRTLSLSLDYAVSYVSKKRSHSSTPSVERQLREIHRGMQAYWLAILNATNAGAFAAKPSSQVAARGKGGGEAAGLRGRTNPVKPTEVSSGPGCSVLATVLLPLYTPRYWRAETVNAFVVALDTWGLSGDLRHVMMTIQRREKPLQQRLWQTVQTDLSTPIDEPSGTPANTESRRPFHYSPALTLRSCAVICAHCLGPLQDPQAAAVAVKYMILSLRAKKWERDRAVSVFEGSTHKGPEEPVEQQAAAAAAAAEAAVEAAEEEEAKWLKQIKTELIPAVDELFARKGIDKDSSWLE